MDKVQRVGVVTVTYNSADVLPEFFDSITRQSFQNFILYVVDNASKDESVKMAQSLGDPRIRIVANAENLGVAEGNNQGIRAALADGCDAVLLLNNDTVFPAELFAELCAGLDRRGCAMTTPKMFYFDRPDVLWAAGGYFQKHYGYRALHYGDGQRDAGQWDTERIVSYAPTCCLLIRKEVFADVGEMDTRYFVYGDDVDFLYRAWHAGHRIWYLPQSRLWHKVNSLTGTMSNFTIRYCTRNRIYFLYKHLARPHAAAWYGLYWIYQAARRFAGKDSADIWKLKRAAMREGACMAR